MKIQLACLAAVTAAALLGCSVHTQAPIKAVAYDFSDRDFYDRAYAPSPDYGQTADARDPWIDPAPAAAAARPAVADAR